MEKLPAYMLLPVHYVIEWRDLKKVLQVCINESNYVLFLCKDNLSKNILKEPHRRYYDPSKEIINPILYCFGKPPSIIPDCFTARNQY